MGAGPVAVSGGPRLAWGIRDCAGRVLYYVRSASLYILRVDARPPTGLSERGA